VRVKNAISIQYPVLSKERKGLPSVLTVTIVVDGARPEGAMVSKFEVCQAFPNKKMNPIYQGRRSEKL
jgi:hypothetical protein